MWFGQLWTLVLSIFVEKAVDKVIDSTAPHVEPEESDWDWTKAPDANPDLKDLSVIVNEANVSLFFGEVSKFIDRGFGKFQIEAIVTKLQHLAEDERHYVEYHVKAFDRGTPLQILTQKLGAEKIGIMVWSDSALSFEIGSLISRFDESENNNAVLLMGLN